MRFEYFHFKNRLLNDVLYLGLKRALKEPKIRTVAEQDKIVLKVDYIFEEESFSIALATNLKTILKKIVFWPIVARTVKIIL